MEETMENQVENTITAEDLENMDPALRQGYEMLAQIRATMRAVMLDDTHIHLEFPLSINLRIDDDFTYSQLVGSIANNGHEYLAAAMLSQAALLEQFRDQLPDVDAPEEAPGQEEQEVQEAPNA